MKISKSSMLYRSAEFQYLVFSSCSWYCPPTDLCTFVRNYFLNFVKTIGVFTFFLWVGSSTLINAFLFLTNGFSLNFTKNLGEGVGGLYLVSGSVGLVIISLTSLVALFIATVYFIIDYWEKKYYARRQKEPGIVSTYIHSRLHKYCAPVEYTE